MVEIHLSASDLPLVFAPSPPSHCSFLQGVNVLRTLPLLYWLLLLPPSSTFPSLPCLSAFGVLDLLPTG